MSTLVVCLFPLVYTVVLLWIGWYLGKYGSPVRWVGFQRLRRPQGTRVAREGDE